MNKDNNEIKIGDTVDCSGWHEGLATCANGEVLKGPDADGDYLVEGQWNGKRDQRYVRPDQITRHVPSAPVVERPASCGDKLASEMTVRERFFYDFILRRCLHDEGTIQGDIQDAGTYFDALIAAIDKERAK